MKKIVKKFSFIILVLSLISQSFLTFPFTAIAEGLTGMSDITIEELDFVDENGQPVSEVLENQEVFLLIDWVKKEGESTSDAIITFPDQIVSSLEGNLTDEDGQSVGSFLIEQNVLILSTEATEGLSGKLKLPVNTPNEAGEYTFDFNTEANTVTRNLNVSAGSSDQSQEQDGTEEDIQEENKENAVEPDKSPSENEDLQDSSEAGDVEAETESIESDASSEETPDIGTSAVITPEELQLIVSATFADFNGNQYSAENPYDINGTDITALFFEWSIPNGAAIEPGDTYEFDLPAAFELPSGYEELSGDLDEYGTWRVDANGRVQMTFNENIETDDVSGTLWFQVDLVEDELSGETEQSIPIDIGPVEFKINIVLRPENGETINKAGVPDRGYNATAINWTVDLNTGLEELTDPVFKDSIPDGLEYREDSLAVYELTVDRFGNTTLGSQIDPDRYTLEVDSDGNLTVTFSELSDAEKYAAYRVMYATDIVEPDSGFDGRQTWTNNATLTNGGETSGTSATVSSDYGRDVEKSRTGYNAADQTIDWQINYNFSQKNIDAGQASITDVWNPSGVMGLRSLSIYPVTISETGAATVDTQNPLVEGEDYVLTHDGNGFVIDFVNDVTSAYRVVYTTEAADIIDGNQEVSNTVTTGTTKTSGSSGSFVQQGVIKNRVNTDVGDKRIDWRIRLNGNSYQMDNLVVTDTFAGDGLSLLSETLRIMDGETELQKGTDYILTYTDPTPGQPGGFEVQFIGDYATITQPLTMEYSTHFERNSDGTAIYGNNAQISWYEGSEEHESQTGNIPTTPDGHTAANGLKYGNYNAQTKRISWTVNTNYARLPIQAGYSINDQLDETQVYIAETLEVYHYSINANGEIIKGDPLDTEDYEVQYPSEDNGNALTVTLNRDFSEDESTIGISFDTEFANELISKSSIPNTAQVQNGDDTFNLSATVPVPYGGSYAGKSGIQAGQYVDWTLYLNPSQSKINNYTLVDEPDLNSVLLSDSFRLYYANVEANGNVTATENLVPETDYTLEIETDNETGRQQFTLKFNEEINEAYVLQYRSRIDADPQSGNQAPVGNSYTVTGDNTQEVTQEETETIWVQVASGGGTATGRRGILQLQKVDENDENVSLADVLFELYTADGETLLRSGTTNAEGIVRFGGLRSGTYILKEISSVEGYAVSEELAAGKEITLSVAEPDQVIVEQVENAKTKATLQKINAAGTLLPGAVFEVYDAQDTLVIEELTLTAGSATLEGLVPGEYTLIEKVAPNGYVKNTDPVSFEIVLNEDGTQNIPTVQVTNYLGSAELLKADAAGNALEGAEFSVYEAGYAEGDAPVLSGLLSGTDGIVRAENLAPGEYVFVETSAPDGYVQNTTPTAFTIESEANNEPATVDAGELVNYQGAAELLKIDAADEPLEGAEFSVYEAGYEEGVAPLLSGLTSDAAGIVRAEGLAPGEYVFVETSAPTGYILNTAAVAFTIGEVAQDEPSVVEVQQINYQGSAELLKTAADNNPLSNAEFKVIDENEADVQTNLISNEDGRLIVTGLAPGNYFFVETQAPEGYVLNTIAVPFTIEAASNGEPAIVEREQVNYQGSAVLTKTDAAGNPLASAEFSVYEAGYAEGDEPVLSILTSGTDGIVRADSLAPGDYVFVETKAPTGYVINTMPVAFTITAEAENVPTVVESGELINYQGSVELLKTDADGNPLTDAEFILLDADGTKVQTDLITDEDGKIAVTSLAPGAYQFVEVNAPEGYILNTAPIVFVIEEASEEEPVILEVQQINYQGSAELLKTDATNTPLLNAEFKVIDENGEEVRTNLMSNEDGKVTVAGLAPGNYFFVETQAPEGYVRNTTPVAFTIESEAADEPEVVAAGQLENYKGSAELLKTDAAGEPLADAEFSIYEAGYAEGDEPVLSILTSGTDGIVRADSLAPGDYVFVEISAPTGYILNTAPIPFTIEASGEGVPAVAEVQQINYQGSAELLKTDATNTPLLNAEFKVIDENGEEVRANLMSNENGKVTVAGLAPGSYFFVETQAPEGYVRNTTPVAFTIESEAADEPEIIAAGQLENYKGSASLVKVGSDDEALTGATFKVVDADGTDVQTGLVSNEDGVVIVSELFPGDYQFVETEPADGYILNTEPVDFTIEAEANGEPAIVATGAYSNYKGAASLIKVGSNGEALAGATFKVVDADGEDVQTGLVSNEDGIVIVSELSPGDYQFVETATADGHILNTEPVDFTIEAEADSEPAVVATGEYNNYKGTASLVKVGSNGEALTGVTFKVVDADGADVQTGLVSNEDGIVTVSGLTPGDYQFIEMSTVEGHILNTEPADFTIAAEAFGEPAIVETGAYNNYKGAASLVKLGSDGEPLAGATFKVVDADGAEVQTGLVSGSDGLVMVSELFPGNYQFIEMSTVEGHILNTEPVDFTIAAEASGELAVVETGAYNNYKGAASLAKLGSDGEPLEGVTFKVVDANGEDVQTELVSNEEGIVTVSELEPGRYYFVETATVEDHILNTATVEFEIETAASGKPEVVSAGEFVNYKGTAQLTKTDASGNGLQGATFEIQDVNNENEVIDTIESGENGLVQVTDLAPGNYKFVEIEASEGFIRNLLEIEFEISAEAKDEPIVVDLGEYANYQGSAILNKLDDESTPLEGAKFAVIDADGEIIQTGLTSDENGKVTVTNLAPGEYAFVEIQAAEGHILNTRKVPFTIEEEALNEPAAVLLGDLTNYQGSAILTKTNEAGNGLEGALFNVIDENGTAVYTNLVSDETGVVTVDNLAPGIYSFVETSAPEGYILNSTPVEFTIKAENLDEPVPVHAGELVNYKGSAELTKMDAKSNPLPGAEFKVIDASGQEIAAGLVTDDKGKIVITDVAPGSYQFIETKAPAGYILNTDPVGFRIATSAEGQPLIVNAGNMVNYQGTVDVTKMDEQNNPLEGAEFKIIDEAGNEVLTDLVSDSEGKLLVAELAPGTYYFIETKAPDGYQLSKEKVQFVIRSFAEGEPSNVEITVVNQLLEVIADDETTTGVSTGNEGDPTIGTAADETTSSSEKLPQTGESKNTIFYVMTGILLVASGIVVLVKRKRMDSN